MESKSILKSKTFWVNIIAAVLGCLAVFNPEILSGLGLGEQAQEKALITIGVITSILNIILRTITNTAITWDSNKTLPVLILAMFFISSCVTPNKALTKVIDYAKTHGEATKVTAPNGVITYTAKYKNFYDPTKLKANYSKLNLTYDALAPSIVIVAATKDTTQITPTSLPTFKK